uniref:Reverse transcriptase domain-containing protein n=1 Tax=Tanacetum cinerariifolium TaxID=118510 RepID=A0A6L2N891_TANCI|nr:reverse transcriptase domain-containing protein [Tanacetum cinerariifolium]
MTKKTPHAYIRYFNKITSTLKFLNVSNTSIKLMLFPFFLEGAARILLEKEPPRSIFTWDDLVSKFINQFFPPSKTINLRNEITNFQQRFDESFSEAWDRFKDLLRACPHHGFSELHQLVTFYNALNSKDQDSLNFAAGGNFLDKMPRECLAIIESKSKVRYSRNKPVVAKVSMNTSTSDISPDVAKLKDMVKALLLDKKSQNQAPATVKAVKESCVTCGAAHSYRNCPATDGNVYQLLTKFVNSNSASTSSSGTLPSNTIANPRSDLKAITTRSGVSYDGPQIPPPPYFLPKVVENEPEATKDTMHPTNNGSTEDFQPPVVQTETPEIQISKSVASPVSAPRPNQRPSIPYPSRLQDQKLRDKANDQREKFFQIFKDLNFNISFADALILMPKLQDTQPANYNDMTTKRIDVIDMACEEYSQEVLGFSDVIASGNPTPYYDPIVSTTSPTLTPSRNSDFLLEEVDVFLAIEDDPTSPKVDQSYLDSEGDILLLEAFLNDDPSLPLICV